MKRILFTFIVYMLVVIASQASASDGMGSKASAFVTNTAERVLSVLNSNATSKEKRLSLKILFRDVVDIEWMGKFVIAKEWKKLTPAQQSEYISVYDKYLVNSYVSKFVEYNHQKYTVNSIKKLDKGHFIVSTEIIDNATNTKIAVSYRLKTLQNGSLKIIDIIGENVSLLATQHSDFGSIISKKGIAGLINVLGKKSTNKE